MAKLQFGENGLLFPPEKIKLTVVEFEDFFVKSFPNSTTRKQLFENYLTYVEDFKTMLSPNFTQWIDGSFVTRKTNPRDIDLVTLLDFRTDIEKEQTIAERFVNRNAIKIYGVDAYTLTVFPDGHRQNVQIISDMLYWNYWFGRSWSNRTGNRYPKGYV